jgi:cytochrome c peroxidase
MVTWLIAGCFVAVVALISAAKPGTTAVEVQAFYRTNLDSLQQTVLDWQNDLPQLSQEAVKTRFKQARRFYKKIEFLVTYHFPATAQQLNGANLLEADISTPNEPKYPTGFQVLEEVVFDPETLNRDRVQDELQSMIFSINRLVAGLDEVFLEPSNILDAIKLNLYRLSTHGITGFDSPVCLNSLPEAETTLQSVEAVLACFENAALVRKSAYEAARYVQEHQQSFDDFDRAVFLSRYLNPLCRALTAYQNRQHIPYASSPPRAIRATAATMFDAGAFDESFYRPAYAPLPDAGLIGLGRQLFYDKVLSGNNSRSCASCHDPAKAFTDGLSKNQSLFTARSLLRNTPTLINAGLQPRQFYDSRVPFLEDQVHAVISSPEEMGPLFSEAVSRIEASEGYRRAFRKQFKTQSINGLQIRLAIAAYVRSLTALNSPFDRYMRGEEQAMSTSAKAGFNVFMGKAKCGTCHFMPLFNGNVPPLYETLESEVLGVPESNAAGAALDADPGKYQVSKIHHQLRQFKTTSVRNAALTAPYMHNGVFKTLAEVIAFYDTGGGIGRGLDVPEQTVSADSLHLSGLEKTQLIAFIESLTDTVIRRR